MRDLVEMFMMCNAWQKMAMREAMKNAKPGEEWWHEPTYAYWREKTMCWLDEIRKTRQMDTYRRMEEKLALAAPEPIHLEL